MNQDSKVCRACGKLHTLSRFDVGKVRLARACDNCRDLARVVRFVRGKGRL